ncbi:hypothetical protein BGY98DRAFT_420909 [Russula aff. rugulosa BPL654]|nr:hypothetical protein BGY98DRAFT_420909 [Russula aff. rugulosa BPL654]
MFRERIRDNADSWFNWSRNVDLPVDRMDDLILVTGCTLVSSYALAVLDDHIADAQISLVNTPLIMKAQVLFGVIFVEPQNITIANSTRIFHPHLGIDVSSSGASEPGVSYSGRNHFELQQNPVLTTLTVIKRKIYK